MLCPIISNSNTIKLTVHTFCYCGLKLTLCYNFDILYQQIFYQTSSFGWKAFLKILSVIWMPFQALTGKIWPSYTMSTNHHMDTLQTRSFRLSNRPILE